jgi:hypothetical protein
MKALWFDTKVLTPAGGKGFGKKDGRLGNHLRSTRATQVSPLQERCLRSRLSRLFLTIHWPYNHLLRLVERK